MCKRLVMITLAVWLGTQGMVQLATPAPTLTEQTGERLRQYIETGAVTFPGAGAVRQLSERLQALYAERLYRPAWSAATDISPQVAVLLEALRGAESEGLQPADYFLTVIEQQLAHMQQQSAYAAATPEDLARLDLLLSAAFVSYGTDLFFGRRKPPTHDDDETTMLAEAALRRTFQAALASGQIDAALHSLLPQHAGYGRLRQALAHYRRLAARGGWPSIAAGPPLRSGDQHAQVIPLKQRLRISGDLMAASTAAAELFDETLERAVRAFQERHGLEVDGVVGQATRVALNVPVETRVQQIVMNMERWRQLPQHLGARYLVVNIPNFTLDVVEHEQVVLSMRVVVGTPQHRTPMFSDMMTYLVLSPYWRVPASIARQEFLPRLRRESGYLATQHIKLLRSQGGVVEEVNPHSIDWSAMSPRNFDYHLRQEPGRHNALGGVKFMFPNTFNVYMHDTPQRTLFARSVRAFSHGCIRLEQPMALAQYVLRHEPYWTHRTILATIARGVERHVQLPEALPVHLVYWTAWVTDSGTLQFRDDIYGHDASEGASAAIAQQHETRSQG